MRCPCAALKTGSPSPHPGGPCQWGGSQSENCCLHASHLHGKFVNSNIPNFPQPVTSPMLLTFVTFHHLYLRTGYPAHPQPPTIGRVPEVPFHPRERLSHKFLYTQSLQNSFMESGVTPLVAKASLRQMLTCLPSASVSCVGQKGSGEQHESQALILPTLSRGLHRSSPSRRLHRQPSTSGATGASRGL